MRCRTTDVVGVIWWGLLAPHLWLLLCRFHSLRGRRLVARVLRDRVRRDFLNRVGFEEGLEIHRIGVDEDQPEDLGNLRLEAGQELLDEHFLGFHRRREFVLADQIGGFRPQHAVDHQPDSLGLKAILDAFQFLPLHHLRTRGRLRDIDRPVVFRVELVENLLELAAFHGDLTVELRSVGVLRLFQLRDPLLTVLLSIEERLLAVRVEQPVRVHHAQHDAFLDERPEVIAPDQIVVERPAEPRLDLLPLCRRVRQVADFRHLLRVAAELPERLPVEKGDTLERPFVPPQLEDVPDDFRPEERLLRLIVDQFPFLFDGQTVEQEHGRLFSEDLLQSVRCRRIVHEFLPGDRPPVSADDDFGVVLADGHPNRFPNPVAVHDTRFHPRDIVGVAFDCHTEDFGPRPEPDVERRIDRQIVDVAENDLVALRRPLHVLRNGRQNFGVNVAGGVVGSGHGSYSSFGVVVLSFHSHRIPAAPQTPSVCGFNPCQSYSAGSSA